MNANDIEEAAGAQIALTVAIAALLALHRGNPVVGQALEQGMEMARAGLLASPTEELKLQAFEDVARNPGGGLQLTALNPAPLCLGNGA